MPESPVYIAEKRLSEVELRVRGRPDVEERMTVGKCRRSESLPEEVKA
jgi:hypothetical protein